MSERPDYWELAEKAISKPLVSHIYTADPSAHVFNGKLYIYPSHDIDAGIPFNDNGDHFGMEDYHVLSVDEVTGVTTDHDIALHLKDVPWASRQMWAPDAAEKNGKYYLFFPARDQQQRFRIGVAVGNKPVGPFHPEPSYLPGSYSIDPAVFKDDDGSYYMYFGGIWGGQLQKYRNNKWHDDYELPAKDEQALSPIVAKLSDNLLEFDETPREALILDENG
ncbi:MAG: family 43 glycosylhydrolase, partial [Bacteroidota bacterium]